MLLSLLCDSIINDLNESIMIECPAIINVSLCAATVFIRVSVSIP
jgi:hypothetical protein